MIKAKYRSVFISDVHLGSKHSKAEYLVDFLKHNSCNSLYIVGDFLDIWQIKQKRWKWKKSHTDAIRQILKISKKSRVVYVVGNHDEFLRPLIPLDISFGKIEIVNKADHICVNGERYLVIHGDAFDGITKLSPWLCYLGDKGYDFVLELNSKFNWIRHKFGFGYWSFSNYLKHKVKGAIDFIFDYEKNITDYCRRKHYTGVINGHIHKAEIKNIEDIMYLNCGDFVESCTAIVEHFDGTFEIVTWNKLTEKTKDLGDDR